MEFESSSIAEALQSAFKFYQQERLDQAGNICTQILKLAPDNIYALHLNGVIVCQKGDFEAGVKFIQKALDFKKDYGEAYYSLGNIHADRNLFDEAINNYTKALSYLPDSPEVLFNLGNAYKNKEEPDKAIIHYQQALAQKPDYVKAYINLGIIYQEKGAMDSAIESFRKALFYNNNSFEALNNLGNALRKSGLFEEAGQCFSKALSLDPNNAIVHYNFGVVMEDQGQQERAVAFYKKAIEFRPDYVEAYNNLGNSYILLGLPCRAESIYKQAIVLEPDLATTSNNLADAFKEQGKLHEAIELYRKALLLKPDYHTCHSNMLLTLNYLPEITQAEIFRESLNWEAQQVKVIGKNSSCLRERVKGKDTLRIGYVSPDFKRHSMATFIEPLVQGHNRKNVEVFLYSNVNRPDSLTGRIQAKADNWSSIFGRSDEEVADEIKRHKIDILVDLTGHTGEGRLLLFARKPAPVQVAWLGYVNTTGLSAVDYLFADSISVPSGEDELFSEKVFRLPRCFFCYKPPESDLPVAESPVNHLGRITFGSLNNLVKINQEVIDLWSQVLMLTENSHLVMVNKQFADDNVRSRFLEMFAGHGISEDRIEMIPGLSLSDFLAVHNRIDIALDPFPFNGLITSCDSLWMGVPVITLRSRTFAGRMGASLMTGLGLQELIADNREEYIDKALSLAGDINRLNELRKITRQKLYDSPVCDIPQFVESVERAYFRMWQDCRSE